MSSIKTNSLGVIVLNAEQHICFALGLGRDSHIQKEVLTLERPPSFTPEKASLNTIHITVNEVTIPYVCISLSSEDMQIIFIREAKTEHELVDFIAAVPFALPILNYFVSSPHIALSVANHKGEISYLSTSNEAYWQLSRGEAINQSAKTVIPNSRLHEVAKSGVAELAQLQVLDGESRIVNRIPIRQEGKVVGAIGQLVFTEPKEFANMREQLKTYEKTVANLKKQIQPALSLIIGESPPIQRIKREILTISNLDVSVLILGNSGTGKELVAKAIHEATHGHQDKPMISLNLAAIPTTLIEAELFGYEPGAFTGGKKEGQKGKFEEAEGGTLFLDEVGDIPLEIQLKLLRVLEDRTIQKIGSNKTKKVNFRLITATHRNIQELIEAGKFRLDLFYRISGVTLRLPALQQRLEDIPLLVPHFIQNFCRRNNLPTPYCSPSIYRYLAQKEWPGNIRQLKQKIEEALVFCDSKELLIENFERGAPFEMVPSTSTTSLSHKIDAEYSQPKPIKQIEYHAIVEAIQRFQGHKSKAAKSLGISRSYLYKILKLYEKD